MNGKSRLKMVSLDLKNSTVLVKNNFQLSILTFQLFHTFVEIKTTRQQVKYEKIKT